MTSTKQGSTINSQLVNAVLNSVTEVFKTMAATEVTFREVRAEKEYRATGDISAVIGIIGQEGEGMFALSFPLPLANLLVGRLLGVSKDSISAEDRCDGVGELVNMVSGSTKAFLSESSNTVYKLSLPTVIQGKDHEISNRPRNCPYLVIQFETEGQNFTMQVSFKNH